MENHMRCIQVESIVVANAKHSLEDEKGFLFFPSLEAVQDWISSDEKQEICYLLCLLSSFRIP